MEKLKRNLVWAGSLSIAAALFQAAIGFSPFWSLYFGAPEALIKNTSSLIIVSLSIAAILLLFGLYALSGAGYIRPLPWLKQMLVLISGIYLLRGLLVVPELIVVLGIYEIKIPVEPRFVFFSIGSLLIGLIYLNATLGGWNNLSPKEKLYNRV